MPPLRRPRHKMPNFVHRALFDAGLMQAYKRRPAYQRNDYIGWIIRAKLEVTQRRRLMQMIEELRKGDVYMKMKWKPLA